MKKEVLDIGGIAAPPSPFSHVVKAGNLIFLSSQLSVDLKTNRVIRGTVAEQTRKALENVRFLVESAGAAMGDVVRTTVYMRDVKDFEEMNKAYREFFESGKEPARVTIGAKSPIEGVDVEIEAMAVLP